MMSSRGRRVHRVSRSRFGHRLRPVPRPDRLLPGRGPPARTSPGKAVVSTSGNPRVPGSSSSTRPMTPSPTPSPTGNSRNRPGGMGIPTIGASTSARSTTFRVQPTGSSPTPVAADGSTCSFVARSPARARRTGSTGRRPMADGRTACATGAPSPRRSALVPEAGSGSADAHAADGGEADQAVVSRAVRSALRGADHLLPELQDLVLIPFGHESMVARTHHSDVAAGHV